MRNHVAFRARTARSGRHQLPVAKQTSVDGAPRHGAHQSAASRAITARGVSAEVDAVLRSRHRHNRKARVVAAALEAPPGLEALRKRHKVVIIAERHATYLPLHDFSARCCQETNKVSST
jgi:hypothetical protein